ncbi:MAG: hypothetical protein ACREB9_07430 [Thermoplasmata archaeon]
MSREVPREEETKRATLIRLAHDFVREAIGFPGLQRISLIGSITTAKPAPKDIDLLVSVEDTADLSLLAPSARRLMGKTQSMGRGADVFLANPGSSGFSVGKLKG